METIENNRLIAEFMGWEEQTDPTERFFGMYYSPVGVWHKENELSFQSSWDWLMPVVEKIQQTQTFDKDAGFENAVQFWRVEIFSGDCQIKYCSAYYGWSDRFSASLGKIGIEAVYDCVVQFIKWHNEQK